jgi:two-component system, response regulator
MNTRPGTILLVEDSDDDVALTMRAFRKALIGNPIHVVNDGAAAIEYLATRVASAGLTAEELPCLILLDLQLPKVNGLDVLRAIRANEDTRLLPVVILTSSAEDRDLVDGYRLGANSYIRKPVDLAQFQEAVAQLGLYWLVVNEAPPPAR